MDIEIKKWEAKIIETALRAYYVYEGSKILYGKRTKNKSGAYRVEYAKHKQAIIQKVLDKILEAK